MLVITRRVGESVKIGEEGETEVLILGVKGTQVRIGVNAPTSIPVHRKEIFDRIVIEKGMAPRRLL